MNRSNVLQLRKRTYTEVEDYLPLEPLPAEEVDDSVPELDAILDLIQASNRMITEAVEKVAASLAIKNVGLDDLVKLEDAIYLPELGGRFTVDPALRTPSDTMSIKTLRSAITDGKLAVIRPNKNLFLTRRLIQEWLENCRDQRKLQNSNFAKSAGMKQVTSRTRQPTTSTMTDAKLRQDAALRMLQQLSKPSQNI